jgi:serine/threonine-protein kinase
MGTGQANGQAVRDELERLLSSSCLARNERVSRLLRFLVERSLEGREGELKESLIGVEVFGRRPDYDPKQDSTVRSEAVRLRARLSKYYAGEGSRDPLIIELPKGGYVPRFRPPDAPTQEQRALKPHSHVNRQRERRRYSLWLGAALAGLGIIVAGAVYWSFRHRNVPVPLAVLPFTNLSTDPANEYFADGLTDEIIGNLSIIDGLAVRSQTSSFTFKGKPRNVREAGRQLEADYILEGSVLRAGQQLRINAQLVRASDDVPVWASRYDRKLTDIFAIQDEISLGIVNSLRLRLGRGRRRYETSVEAYDLYLRARALRIQRDLPGYDESIAPLEEAIARDASFAPAYAGLAAAHAVRSFQFRFDFADETSKMRAAAERAIQLDPLLAEAHAALGMAYARDAQWERSEKSFRRAIELDPNNAESYDRFAMFLLWPLSRISEAVEHLRFARKTDPLSPHIQDNLASVLIVAGRYSEAAGLFESLPADYPGKTELVAGIRLHQGRITEAIQILESNFSPGVAAPEARASLGYAYALAGRREEAEKLAAAGARNPFNQAVIFAALGDKDRTFEALDRAVAAGPFRLGRALTRPEFVLLHGDQRVKWLRKKVGLPE